MATSTDTSPVETVPETPPLTASDLHLQGNACVKAEQYKEAVLCYTSSLKIKPDNHIIYGNRSLAYLRLKQYYLAYEDAEKAIQLASNYEKAYYRRAEVQVATGQYDAALLSFAQALQCNPDNKDIWKEANRTSKLINEEKTFEKKFQWMGAGVGIIVGVLIILGDQMTTRPTVSNPMVMVAMVVVVSCIGYGIARAYRFYVKVQLKGLLEPPLDRIKTADRSQQQSERYDGMENGQDRDQHDATSPTAPPRNRYSRAQARQRIKRGKS